MTSYSRRAYKKIASNIVEWAKASQPFLTLTKPIAVKIDVLKLKS
jgi:hypothetical protein